MDKEGCVFCEIVGKKKESYNFYEDDEITGFMDLYPVENGHALIMPNNHYENIFDIELKVYLKIQGLARIVAMAMREALGAEGINIGQNNGECANQKVNHYHLHVIPRWESNNINWGRIEMSREELRRNSEILHKTIDGLLDQGFKIWEC